MLKKIIITAILLLIVSFVWNEYGYLLSSYKNWPKSEPVADSPLVISPATTGQNELSHINIRAGHAVSYFATDVPGARSLTVGDTGVVYVGTRGEGVVYALEDKDKDGQAETRYVVSSGLNSPNGVVYHENNLYVAEIDRIIKFENIDQNYQLKPTSTTVYADLPIDSHHGWRYMALGPDSKLYLGIGAPCNVCEVDDPYGSIARLNLDGTGFEVIARGIRNTVGFDWNPEDQSLWFTENGRDLLGDDVPGDELNQLKAEGEHFGFPYCHAGEVLDPELGKGKSCANYESPSVILGPHVAALGMKFIDGQIFIAEHGSWNRRVPIGYRLMTVDVTNGVASNYQVFAEGWLGENGKAKGRPVDVLELPDKSILVSDDFAGAVYRITKP